MLGNHFKMTENIIAAIKKKQNSNSKGSPFQPGNCTKLSNCVGAAEDFYTVFINDFEAKRFSADVFADQPSTSHFEIFKDSS